MRNKGARTGVGFSIIGWLIVLAVWGLVAPEGVGVASAGGTPIKVQWTEYRMDGIAPTGETVPTEGRSSTEETASTEEAASPQVKTPTEEKPTANEAAPNREGGTHPPKGTVGNEGWGRFVDLDRLPLYFGAKPSSNAALWLRGVLPELPAEQPYLWIDESAAVVNVRVYIDGRLRFESDESKLPVGLRQWDFVPLQPDDAGKPIEVRLANTGINHEFAIWTGTQTSLSLRMLLDDLPLFALGVVLLLLGAVSAFLYARFRGKLVYALFALFTVSASIRFALWGGSWQLFASADSLLQIGYFAYADWYVVYASYLLLYEAVLESGYKRVVRGCAWAFLLFGAAHFASLTVAGRSVDDFFYYHLFYYLAPSVMLVLFVVTGMTLFRKRDTDTLLMIAGFMTIVVTDAYVFSARLLIPLPVSQTSPGLYAWLSADWSNYGIAIFVACVGAILIRRFADVYRNAKLYAGQLEEHNERLRQLDRLKDEFLANTSHELRTPLHGIVGLIESLLDGAAGRLPAAVASNLAMVRMSARRLTHLINDILDYSRLKHRDIRIRKTAVDLSAQADMIMALTRPFVGGKPIELINAIPPSTYIEGDPDRIQQILQNLIGNAVKFTERGTIRIDVRKRAQADRLVEIGVSDTGIGIAEDKLEAIFGSFEQADGSISREYGGTGLGLAVTKRLIELHGGTIRAVSAVGEGSHFLFTLPVADAPPPRDPEEERLSRTDGVEVEEAAANAIFHLPMPGPETKPYTELYTEPHKEAIAKPYTEAITKSYLEPSAGPSTRSIVELGPEIGKGEEEVENKVKEEVKEEVKEGREEEVIEAGAPVILIVDDDPVNLRVLAHYIRLGRYAVRQAESGRQALAMIESGFRPDLVVLDVMMPRMSGYELCASLRETYGPSELPILFLTAKHLVRDVVEGFRAGGNDYVMKPVTKEELLSRIQLHLRVHKWHLTLERHVEERTRELADVNTELDRANRELEQAYRDLSAAEQSRRRFLSDISHELRTPLTSIQGYVKGMLDGIAKFQDLRYVQRIYDKTVYLHRIIKDLFDLAKLETGQMSFELRRVDVLDFVHELRDRYAAEAAMHGIVFGYEGPPRSSDFAAEVDIDPIRIEQVLSNFFANAVAFTPPGGEVRLIVRLEAAQGTEGRVRISLRDTGSGIDGNDLPHVFERLYRSAKSRGRTEGAGLGLAISKEIIRHHGGDIGVESKPGEGSEFYFTLPAYVRSC